LFSLVPQRGQEPEWSREKIAATLHGTPAVAFSMATELGFKRLGDAAGNGTAPIPYKEQIFHSFGLMGFDRSHSRLSAV
jgi:hypothetical protein